MTTSISEIALASIVSRSATREAGMEARHAIVTALNRAGVVRVDLTGVRITPSFADECFGVLAQEIGKAAFQRRVKLANVPPSSRPLLKHVLVRRTQQTAKGKFSPAKQTSMVAAEYS